MEAYVQGRRVRLDPSLSIGKGGEADIFDIGNGKALKLFKQPDHPDFAGLPQEQLAAEMRIAEHQQKLRAFPKNLPQRVVSPEDLATNRAGNLILGYTLNFVKNAEVLLRYADKVFRQAGITNDMVVRIFLDVHKTVSSIHKANVVLGDFNDLNVLVRLLEAYFIDADSFQFGKFVCRLFTARFVDPLLCDPREDSPMLIKPHTGYSDWYAFNVMLMQCLLFVEPYGGVYFPKNPRNRVHHNTRPLRRITVFHPEVKYPKAAAHYSILPDDLLQHFHLVFEKDKRSEFPVVLLSSMHWTKCSVCGTEHARNICPVCLQAAPPAIKEVTTIRGRVTATRIFKTSGLILHATYQNGKLLWLYHENSQFKREDGSSVVQGDLDALLRFRIHNKSTLIGKGNQVAILTPGEAPAQIVVDCFGSLPVFDTNESNHFWLQKGMLMRSSSFGSENIGTVLEGQTLFWTGPKFGFGFYRAGNLCGAFVFDAEGKGINDTVKIPQLRGQLVDSTCCFSKDHCWFFVSIQEGGKTINRCILIRPNGNVDALAEAQQGDGSWLSSIRGKCAAGNFLLAATDDGIVRVEADSGKISVTKEFPDTEPFVNSGHFLFPSSEGLYAVSAKEIVLLKIN